MAGKHLLPRSPTEHLRKWLENVIRACLRSLLKYLLWTGMQLEDDGRKGMKRNKINRSGLKKRIFNPLNDCYPDRIFTQNSDSTWICYPWMDQSFPAKELVKWFQSSFIWITIDLNVIGRAAVYHWRLLQYNFGTWEINLLRWCCYLLCFLLT